MFDIVRIMVEVVSAVACFVLVRFMIKPYGLTGETRYLGLPLGFVFLGTSYTLSAALFSIQTNFYDAFHWLQLMVRTFAFVFLAMTYYFSKKPSKNSRIMWDITFSLITVALTVLLLVLIIAPQSTLQAYYASQIYIRIFNVLCLTYIVVHIFRSNVKKPDPTIVWIPSGFTLLAISQYSLLFYYTDGSIAAFAASLGLRLLALAVFLFVGYQVFYSSEKGTGK